MNGLELPFVVVLFFWALFSGVEDRVFVFVWLSGVVFFIVLVNLFREKFGF